MLESELLLLDTQGISWLTVMDSDYPALLKEIAYPPLVLYVRGAPFVAQERRLAIVGSRAADSYGKEIITALVDPLVAHGFVLVSGGAVGADGFVHAQTVAVGGKTVAVLGSGLLKPYPPSNKKLFFDIVEHGGTIVSPFPLSEQPRATNFPIRNRIISGLSMGCLVVQAAAKSGACITAQYAVDQSRDVFAVPGPWNARLSVGCNRLIQQGAKLVIDAGDILSEYGIEWIGNGVKKDCTQAATVHDRIVSYCLSARSLDEIAAAIKLPMTDLHANLFELQVQGKIWQNGAGLFVAHG